MNIQLKTQAVRAPTHLCEEQPAETESSRASALQQL